MDKIDIYKLLSVILIIAVGFTGVYVAPKKMSAKQNLFRYGEALTSGIFLSIGFIHFLPDGSETLKEEIPSDFPYAELYASIMIVFLISIEKVIVPSFMHGGEHKRENEVLENELDGLSRGRTTGSRRSRGGGGHSHDFDFQANTNMLFAIIMFTSLMIHSFIVGFSFGLTKDMGEFWVLFFAILNHKFIAGFSLGINLAKAFLQREQDFKYFVIFGVIFTFSTPLGVVFGWVTENSDSSNTLVGIIISLSAGTFIYISLSGLRDIFLPDESNYGVLGLLIVGFACMSILAIWM